MQNPLAIALWIITPVVLSGLTHVAVIKLGLFKVLASVPLDLGATVQGRRLFGENKTLRGAAVMVVATAAWVLAQNRASVCCHWASAFSPPFERMHPLAWGALAGAGYVAGELPNSFVKRRFGISAGAAAHGIPGAIFWIVDQVDSVLGVLAFLYPVWRPAGAVVVALFGITFLVHPAVALVMFCLGLKDRIG
jgi:CDP-diacylglycerol--serine O-phosphatidyltransferase